MPRTKIKICGITREEDGRLAAQLGVDALGFVLAESPRKISPERVRSIRLSLPPFVSAVGVFFDRDMKSVQQIASYCRLDCVQLHGDVLPEDFSLLECTVLKAIRVKDRTSLETMASYERYVQGFVLDAYVKGKQGGTGQTFDWALAEEARAYGPIILAGGLTPNNVEEAVRRAAPYGVDVSSGVESAPGVKDPDKMRRFVRRVRSETSLNGPHCQLE